jgi:CRP/FNR family transcriptional regulator, cyclic AMP receptor protein
MGGSGRVEGSRGRLAVPASRVHGVASARTRLLDEDPELGRWLSPSAVLEARRRTQVPVLRLPTGAWRPRHPGLTGRDHLGFIVLDGLLARDETLAGSTSTELIGPGDLIQPWAAVDDGAFVPRIVSWTTMQPTRLAVLGPSFVAAIEPWPELRSALLERALQRCSRISTHHALSQLSRVDARLLVLFWHLAERWGRVTGGGVVMPVRLSHAALGHLVGAKRPTVSLALRRLRAEGLVARRADRSWLLSGTAEQALERLDAYSCSKATVSLYSSNLPA